MDHQNLAHVVARYHLLNLLMSFGHFIGKRCAKLRLGGTKKNRKKEENFEKALQIVNTLTTVDILWQDGQIESGVSSVDLVPIEIPRDHEFVAEQYVVEKSTDDEESNVEAQRVGVLKRVKSKERTACVIWLKPVLRAEDPREFDKEETVSVYQLEGHPDYDYCYGDVVVRLSFVSSLQTAATGNCVDKSCMKDIPKEGSTDEENNSSETAQEKKPSSSFTNLSWVGNITGLRNGDIEVTWADGMVGPQAIYVGGRDDDATLLPGAR